MQENADISVTPSHCTEPGQIRRLLETFPAGKWSDAFRLELPREDPLVSIVLGLLDQMGLTPRNPQQRGRPGLYELMIHRKYDQQDFAAARYLEPHPVGTVGLIVRRSRNDRLLLRPRKRPVKNFIASANWPWIVVSRDVKEKLEDSGLQRLRFLEIDYTQEVPEAGRGQLWELTSDLRLPRMSPRCTFVREIDGAAVDGGWQPNTILVEGNYPKPEFHYTESAIRSIEPFDLALTFEGWGGGEGIPKLVDSQRFYQFCKNHKLKMDWIPVRMDPD